MVKRALAIVVALAGSAAADGSKLAAARAEVDAVHYPDAQRLLGEALAGGGNSPADVREIYRLAAKVEAALGHADVAEQFYRRWLVLDPHASLAAGDSPKLQAPFAAARAFVQANGGLLVHVDHTTDVDVSIVADPLAMAVAVARGAEPAVPFAADRHAHLVDGPGPIAVLDERGNHLTEIDVPPAPVVTPPRLYPPPLPAPQPGGWKIWAVGAGAFTAVAIGFGIAAIALDNDASSSAANSGDHFLSDVETSRDRARLFAYMSAGAMAVGIGLAIPAIHYYPNSLRAFVTGNGVAIAGGF